MRAARIALLVATLLALPILLAADAAQNGAKPAASQGVPTDENHKNGFDLSDAAVPARDIVAGGPPRDRIRSVDAPHFAPFAEAGWLGPETPVLGVKVGGEARIYPVGLLEFHQIVNDVIGDVEVAVTYGPLAGTPRAFLRKVDGKVLEFGVSGLLYNSNFLMYDRQTESLWSQFEGKALSGPLKGKVLERLPIYQEVAATLAERFPDAKVLAPPEPEKIDYRLSPYRMYWMEDRIPYPVAHRDERYHAKELVLGVEVGGRSRAYLGSIVTAAGGVASDEFAGRPIQVDYDTDLGMFRWEAPDDVVVSESYWFAWKAFHPDTEVWKPPQAPDRSGKPEPAPSP